MGDGEGLNMAEVGSRVEISKQLEQLGSVANEVKLKCNILARYSTRSLARRHGAVNSERKGKGMDRGCFKGGGVDGDNEQVVVGQ